MTLVFGLAPGLSSATQPLDVYANLHTFVIGGLIKVEESALALSSDRLLASELLKMPARSCVLVLIQKAHNLADQTSNQRQIAILFQR